MEEMNLYLLNLGLLVCNEVYTFNNGEKITFKGTSNEDIAIIDELKQLKIDLIQRTKKYINYSTPLNKKVHLQILRLFSLEEEKNQLGIIIKDPLLKKTFFFVKGRQNEIENKIKNP